MHQDGQGRLAHRGTRVAAFTGPSRAGGRAALRGRYGIAEQGLAPGRLGGCVYAQPPLPPSPGGYDHLRFPEILLDAGLPAG
jgi:hypothetical protein